MVSWNMILSVIALVKQVSGLRLPFKNILPSDFSGNTVQRIIERLGLIYERYEVTTEDGYVLNLNRMINPDIRNQSDKGIPVLFVHGLAMHSDSWLLQTKPTTNLPVAFLLAGYDIWLGDQRGSLRSIKHRTIDTESRRFWDFSIEEIGVYDLPAFIDFILRKTGHEKLVYVGLSDGGSFYYVMCTEKPAYQEKLYGGILFAPVGESPPFSSQRFTESESLKRLDDFVRLEAAIGIGRMPPLTNLLKTALYRICRLAPQGVINIMEFVAGRGCRLDPNVFCKQLVHSLGGTSGKTFLHTIQFFQDPGVFKKYNYGRNVNQRIYGRPYPPVYDIRKLKVFTAIYHSNADIYTPSSTILPFAEKFQGPKYLCQMKGVCHTFNFMDDRAEAFVGDAVQVLYSMTGRTDSTKMNSGGCGDIRISNRRPEYNVLSPSMRSSFGYVQN